MVGVIVGRILYKSALNVFSAFLGSFLLISGIGFFVERYGNTPTLLNIIKLFYQCKRSRSRAGMKAELEASDLKSAANVVLLCAWVLIFAASLAYQCYRSLYIFRSLNVHFINYIFNCLHRKTCSEWNWFEISNK